MTKGIASWKPYLGIVVAGSASFSMSTLFSSMKPVLLTRFVEQAHYSQSLAGLTVAMPFLGGVFSAFAMHVILQRLNYRQAAILFSAGLVICELINSLCFTNPAIVLVCQFISGFSVGALMGVTSRLISQTHDPHRIFGFVDMMCVLLMSFFMAGIGAAVEAKGLAGGFQCALAIAIALSALMFAYRQKGGAALGEETVGRIELSWRPVTIILMGILFITFSGLGFTYMFTIARNLGFTYESAGSQIGIILFFSSFACALGGWCSARFGAAAPLAGAFVSCAIGWWIAIHTTSPLIFLAALVPAVYALQFACPILLALAGSQDKEGHWAAVAAPLVTSGFAWAAIASGVIVDRWGLHSLSSVTLAGMMICGLLLWITVRRPAALPAEAALQQG